MTTHRVFFVDEFLSASCCSVSCLSVSCRVTVFQVITKNRLCNIPIQINSALSIRMPIVYNNIYTVVRKNTTIHSTIYNNGQYVYIMFTEEHTNCRHDDNINELKRLAMPIV